MTRPTEPVLGDVDPALPPPDVLARARARVLDPATATRFDRQVLRPTVYVADELLVLRSQVDRVSGFLVEAAKALGMGPQELREGRSSDSGLVMRFIPLPKRAVEVDAWEVLQRARQLALEAGADLRGVGLNHLMSVGAFGPVPYDSPQPYDPAYSPGSPYADLAYSGPRPVALPLVNKPARGKKRERDLEHVGRRPVVAVVDTGCGSHPWLNHGVYRETLGSMGTVAGGNTFDQAEQLGNALGRLDGMRDPFAGHGTFICGLVRQACPEAEIVSLPIVSSDGNNDKGALAAALNRILDLIKAGVIAGVDVVSLSMGSYLEEEDDPNLPWRLPPSSGDGTGDSDEEDRQQVLDVLLDAIQKLTDEGIVVVAAAGNDGTTRKFYPAAFVELDGTQLPHNAVLSVGALNPNRSSITLFSNGGSWVKAWDVGVAVVSTMPDKYQHSLHARARTIDQETGAARESVDEDDFTGLFAIASGTSYAAPVMAGRIAGAIYDRRRENFEAARQAGTTGEALKDSVKLTPDQIATCVQDQIDGTHPPKA
ncbi:S8 family peptidase [Virgisporangium aurantiacum]|uniref:Peptidase S8 n=1 Tax=Virgisporangium aurantiacum TaxID=175570 RepID=A0A8J4E2F2_9ACTN|nr:S8 family serine peptidase [Virgisporangium aurantiacum]GIJ58929.1 peptidase S8 [Virgisporangium aurantiacum]